MALLGTLWSIMRSMMNWEVCTAGVILHSMQGQFKFQKQPPVVVYLKSVLKIFAKFRGKLMCQSLFFKKVY